jgi:hypothetical protein
VDTLEAWDVDPGYAVEGLRAVRPADVRAVAAAGTHDLRRPLRPFVWLLAVGVLLLRAAGQGGVRVLEGYERAADATGRAVVRAAKASWRAVLRVLGPLGRLLRRLLAPAWRLVVRLWDRLGLWLLLRLLRPVGRVARRVLARVQPALVRLLARVQAVLARLEPALQALLGVVGAIERGADRLAMLVRRAWVPVARATPGLAGRRRSSRDPDDG